MADGKKEEEGRGKEKRKKREGKERKREGAEEEVKRTRKNQDGTGGSTADFERGQKVSFHCRCRKV